ncbi:MAG TPA: hypothetical protein VG672_21980 [Bryobacteraceae bacterium]|nr:hypothetical protein [Bryobacteraceae bacterium]
MRVLRIVFLSGCAGLLLAQPQTQTPEYQGPSILTRGTGPSNAYVPETSIRPYFLVQGTFDNALTPVSVDSQGNVTKLNSYGVEAQVGLYGEHQWKRNLLELDYRGNYRDYAASTYLNGFNHLLRLALTHTISKRSQVRLLELAGTYARSFLAGMNYYDGTIFQTLPTDELFDSRVNYFLTSATYIYQKTPRLSFSASGDGFLVRRQATALYGVTGAAARGDMAYRISRRTTVGLNYEFSKFDFTKAFGGTQVHTLGINYATRISRLWEFGLFVGGSRVESQFLQNVTLDPVVAAILGETRGTVISHNIHWAPAIEARLVRAFHRAAVSVQYTRRINPGNGVYLTSQGENAVGAISYTGVRSWSFNMSAGYSAMKGLVQSLGGYRCTYVGAGATHHLAKDFFINARIDNRRYDVGTATDFTRNPLRVVLGIGWSPGEHPLSVW